MITLNGRQVLKLKKIDTQPLKDKNGEPYCRFAYGTKVFIARTDFTQSWEDGNIAEMDLEEGTREVTDPETGATHTVPTITLAGFITNKQDLAVAKHEAEVGMISKKLEKELQLDGTGF